MDNKEKAIEMIRELRDSDNVVCKLSDEQEEGKDEVSECSCEAYDQLIDFIRDNL